MEINPIKTDADHRAALKEIEGLMMAEPNSPEGDRLDVLVTLVAAYEEKHFPIGPPTPIEAIKFRMDQQGLRPVDVAPIFGRVNRYYEVMAGHRKLTLPMIRRLHSELKIPFESLLSA